jgi:diaminopimelate decarboxylase
MTIKKNSIGKLRFLTDTKVRELTLEHKTPFFVYSLSELSAAIESVKKFATTMPYGTTIRYAMKANEHPAIIKHFTDSGISFDASSPFEARKLLEMGVDASKILLTSQQLPDDLQAIIDDGVQFTATSLHQLQTYCRLARRGNAAVRINPGMGSGLNNRLTTGGVNAGFGIWHEYIDEALKMTNDAKLHISRLHMHIGTGADPEAWIKSVATCLDIVRQLSDVTVLDIGGGFKTAYMPEDKEADMELIGSKIAGLVENFARETGRELHIEIEPGRFLVAHAGSLVSTVIDLTDTGEKGHKFIRLNSGMTEILRPAMYGSQHQLVVVPHRPNTPEDHDDFVVVGHCCESGDCLTVRKDDPETLEPRMLRKPAIGDYIVIESAGAYCASMAATGYNAFPRTEEIVID